MNNKSINIIKLICNLCMVVTLSLFALSAHAQVAKPSIDFNHMKTGFPLTGAHAKVQCETCHTGGLFKGTPKDCAGCHSVGRRVVAPAKSANHMLTTAACETCHTNDVTFLGARFNHLGVQPKGCMSCHRGLTAPGKPNGHVQTTASCDSCHRTSSWIPAGFDHAAPLPTCETCHGPAGPAKGMNPANHVPTNGKSCDSCHTNFVTFLGAIFDHIGATQCNTCHITGQYGAKTKTAGHIPTGSTSCDSCHLGNGFVSFAGATMKHDAVLSTPCSTCHNGSYISQKGSLGLGAQSKLSKPNHVVTTAECGDCHLGRSTFIGGYFNHVSPPAGQVVVGNCNSCHDGTHALGKTNSATHAATNAQCDSCHNPAAANNGYTSFAGATFNHVGVAGICGTCHLGQTAAKTKTNTHIPTTGNACDLCHVSTANFTSFAAPTMQHSAVLSIACFTCHNGNYITEGINPLGARAMPSGHIAINGASCGSCHSSTAWLPASYNHTGVTPTTCGTCHIPGTSGAKQKPAGTLHIPTSGNACDSCHKSGYAVGAFASFTMNHTAVTSFACKDCHVSIYSPIGVKVVPTLHIPMNSTVDCKDCHSSTTSFTTEKMNHVANSNTVTCTTCHSSTATYLGNMIKKVLGTTSASPSEHRNASPTANCSNSGCHRPVGTIGSTYSTWN